MQRLTETTNSGYKNILQLCLISSYGFLGFLFPPLAPPLAWISIAAKPSLLLAEAKSPRKAIVLPCLFLSAFVISEFIINLTISEQPIIDRFLDAQKWIILFIGYIPLSCWLKGDSSRIFILIISSAAGMITGLLIKANPYDIISFKMHGQDGFLLKPAISSLSSIMTISGIIIFRSRIFKDSTPKRLLTAALATISATYLSSYILAASQYRTAYISLLLSLPLLVTGRKKIKAAPDRKYGIAMTIAALVMVSYGLKESQDTLIKRISPDLKTLSEIFDGHTERLDLINQSESSLGYRVEALKAGLGAWKEHPLLGWGPLSSETMIRESNKPSLKLNSTGKWLVHYHCSYLEIAIRFGAIGLLLISMAATAAWKAGGTLLDKSNCPNDLKLFIRLGLLMMIPWGATGIYTLPNATMYIIMFTSVAATLMRPSIIRQTH